MFKKAVGLMMTVMMVCSLAACGQAPASSSAPAPSSSSSSAPEAPSPASSEMESEASSQQTSSAPVSGSEAPETPEPSSSAEESPETSQGKTLVAYFSWSGNTEEMASYIAAQTGGELYEIEPTVAYPEDYNETGDVAKAERDNNQRPAIANLPDSLDGYDTILVGYPIWWHTAPMIIGTFLESYDLTGVEVYPFTQSASMDTEQFENSMEFIRETAGNGNVHDGLFVVPSNTAAIDAYLSSNGIAQ